MAEQGNTNAMYTYGKELFIEILESKLYDKKEHHALLKLCFE